MTLKAPQGLDLVKRFVGWSKIPFAGYRKASDSCKTLFKNENAPDNLSGAFLLRNVDSPLSI
jgi:hypothetical protein